jgi:hypothetical protein
MRNSHATRNGSIYREFGVAALEFSQISGFHEHLFAELRNWCRPLAGSPSTARAVVPRR